MEREKSPQYSEAEERERKPDALLLEGYVVQLRNLEDIHRCCPRTGKDAENTDQQKSGTAHQHERQLHGGIFLPPRSPDTDEQIHGDQRYFVEHEHGEEIDGNKESEYAQRQ